MPLHPGFSIPSEPDTLHELAWADPTYASPVCSGVDVAKVLPSTPGLTEWRVELSVADRNASWLGTTQLPETDARVGRLRVIASLVAPFIEAWLPKPVQPDWRTFVTEAKAPHAINHPTGSIFLTSGLMALDLTDDEIAAIVAHEMAHVQLEHVRARLYGQMPRLEFVTGTVEWLLAGGSPAIDSEAAMRSYFPDITRMHQREIDADLVGAEAAARAGFDPRAMISVLHKITNTATNPAGWARLLDAHPPGSERLAHLQSNMPCLLQIYEAATAAGGSSSGAFSTPP